ncbi:unnamed protein product [Linum tenue]|uniref:Uncharacterized protein n=1 Tax=Linum tenue TaxID=586396 RepID=A0AAV0QMZ9_9ROSI|nr:unnamed protein product [Linum tenue]CAI0546271.1 unnamed protein product [Linum tenue]
MGKSIRSKREKRLRAIRRDMIQPLYDKIDEAKLAAIQAALAAPKLPVKPSPFESSSMDTSTVNIVDSTPTANADDGMLQTTNAAGDIEMDDENGKKSAKPWGKKLKKKFKLARNKRRGGKGNFKLKKRRS